MRNLSAPLSAHLSAGVTTLCRVFIVQLSDGRRFAFTDHDQPLSFEGLIASPMRAAQTEQRSGFDADSGAMKAVFSLDLDRAETIDGVLDGATLADYRVNWNAPEQFILLTRGRIGAVTVTETGFEAEWLGQATVLDRSTGRVFSRRCDAEYGDARCGLTAQTGQSCARTFDACKAFGNGLNYRGFPYLLGDDVLQKGVHLTPTRKGGSRYV